MTERIDHVAEARNRINEAHAGMQERGETEEARLDYLEAQAHATLALVEQQRVANLIAYAHLLETQYAEAAKHPEEFDWDGRPASLERHAKVLERIREALGLGDG